MATVILNAVAVGPSSSATCEHCKTTYEIPGGLIPRVESTCDMPPPARLAVHGFMPRWWPRGGPVSGLDWNGVPTLHACNRGRPAIVEVPHPRG